ncbi:Suppressor of cytokine signaling 6 [Harpegnathos saltator]|uniref:Suppressor of cytokine signaling 6 n=2 Tax=Harpegnathos saltator TaxID=610380 RepID=E2BSH4_HARSA|nr:Suppressor of cytokine signaling 6 [Harpegnathos saltator]
MEHKFKTATTSGRMSFTTPSFFRNIKKYLQIKNMCRSKPKDKEAETTSPFHITNQSTIVSTVDLVVGLPDSHQEQEHSSSQQEIPSNRQSYEISTNLDIVSTAQEDKATCDITSEISDAIIAQPSCLDTTAEVPSAIADVSCDANETLSDENEVKASLAEELLNLNKYGWYWGPISADQADAKLISEPDGAFLVRDSSDDRHVLTLSFKSSGKILHTRMEHSGGLFSLCYQHKSEGFTSVAALINHSMNFSQSAVFCYSRPRYPGYPSFPVRLTKPVSRFTQVKSLQYLCRFVIRQNTSLDNIHKLLLPESVKLYILESHYWT